MAIEPQSPHRPRRSFPMNRPLISISNLNRWFGPLHAVQNVSFDIFPGSVVGFIGANGAGKTTTMRMMATLDLPDSGEISIDGIDVVEYPLEIRRKVGWMPDAYGVYPNMTVAEYLDFFARAFGYLGADRRDRVAEVMDFTELTPLAERSVDALSKGMGQRLCLGRTLIHDPPVLILDEPAAGLDPKARIEFKHLVRILAEEGKTIFISSHILTELSEMCDQFLFIDNGKIVHHGSAESLQRREGAGIAVAVELNGPVEDLEKWVLMQPGLSMIETRKNGCLIRIEDENPDQLTALLKKMLNENLPVIGFQREQQKLEDAFVSLLQKLENENAVPPPLPAIDPNSNSETEEMAGMTKEEAK